MKHLSLFGFLLASIHFSFAQPTITLQSYATGFSSPVDIANCADDRLFIVEQAGVIRIIDGTGAVKPTPFLDINSRVMNPNGGEEGLLGLAFHPDYKNNGYFFVYYVNNSGNLVIARFSVTSNPDVADANSETNVLTISHPGYSNHNGGNLEFGPDGMLYIGTGDGGGGGDPDDNSQDPLSLLGKIMRLDVDTLPYIFPPDNPYYGFASVRNEIWARGVRNPWRFSFDRLTGDLWIGDVGQNAREEVDFQPASSTGGENYGWKCYEGNITYGTSSFGCNGTYVFPVYDYDNNSIGCTVVGGYRYRGCKYPDLFGYYIFADYCSGRFWETHDNSGTWVTNQLFDDVNFRYVSFGEDRNGELYVSGMNGTIYRITEDSPTALPAITPSGTISICPYDSVTLSAVVGTSSTQWQWFKDEAPISTNLLITAKDEAAYTLTVTDFNGCVYTTPATTVVVDALPNPVITATMYEYCAGDSLQLTAGTFTNYLWSDGATTQTNYVQQGIYSVTVADANNCTAASSSVTITETPLPQPVIQQTGTLCGTASSVTLSTTAPFWAYAWSTGETTATATVTLAGNYDVTVMDWIGCEGVAQFTVVAQSALTPVLQTQNGSSTLCGGETTELYLTESFDAYLWSTGDTVPSITVQQAGDYWVEVSDTFGCSGISDTLAIITVPSPSPVLSSQNGLGICPGDSTELFLTESFIAYLWSTSDTSVSITASQAGEYWVLVIDSFNCLGTSDTVQITTLPAPAPNILQGDSVVQCGDGVIELFTDAAFEKYFWSRGDTVPILFTIESGIFNVTVEDTNGCVGVSDDVVVEIFPNPLRPTLVDYSSSSNFIQCADSGYSYQWFNCNTTCLAIQGETQQTLIFSDQPYGYFFVEITDSNGCKAESDSLFFWEGILETWLGSISIQPNPFTNELLLNYTLKDLADIRISMKDVAGKEIALLLDEKKGAGSYSLEISSAEYQLSQGVYFLEIANGTSRKAVKVVKL